MASGLVKVLAAILALGFGVGMAYFWSTLRPEDELLTLIGVGAVTAIASFACMYFLTKGSGGD